MSFNPWDFIALHIYNTGDEDEDTTYAGIGRVVCAWEEIEVELSILYSMITGRPTESEAIREYGEGRIFADRLRALERKARAHFVRKPNQQLEGDFCGVIAAARGYADRRNEVSHGSVRIVRRQLPEPDGKMYYLLLPSHYDVRRFDANDMPKFYYSSENLSVLNERMFFLARSIEVLANDLADPDEKWLQ
jgi:hypothetical protein